LRRDKTIYTERGKHFVCQQMIRGLTPDRVNNTARKVTKMRIRTTVPVNPLSRDPRAAAVCALPLNRTLAFD